MTLNVRMLCGSLCTLMALLVQFRMILKKKGKSAKLQAASNKRLTTGPGDDRMNLERNNYEIKSKF